MIKIRYNKRWLNCARRLLRTEYLVGLWLGALATVVLWYRPPSPDATTVIVAFCYAGVLYWCGFLANAIGDRELDSEYGNHKSEIALAVKMVGARTLSYVLALMLLAGLALGVWTSWLVASAVPLILGIIGIVAGIGYSVPPFRWKIRGFIWHSVSLGASAFFLPVFLLIGVLGGHFDLDIALLSLGYALAHYGLEIGNQLKDYEKDRLYGILTLPSESLSLSSVVGLSFIVLGLVVEWLMIVILFKLTAWLGVITGTVLVLAHLDSMRTYLKVIREPQRIIEVFRDLDYSRWQVSAMLGYLILAVIIRLVGGQVNPTAVNL